MTPKKFFSHALILGATTIAAQAIVFTWDAGGDGINWSDDLNWNQDAQPILLDANNDQIAQVNGADIVIANLVNAAAGKIENGGLTGGSLTIETSGSLTVQGSLEVNRKDGDSLLDVNGGTLNNSTGTLFVTHFIDATTPEDPTEGTLTIRNGGSVTTTHIRSDGGVSFINIADAGSSLTTSTNNRFANNDSCVNHFNMSDGAMNTTARDYWGGTGSTFTLSGGIYTHGGDQFHFALRAGDYDDILMVTNSFADTTITLSGGTLTSAGHVYLGDPDAISATVTQTAGLLQLTGAGRDLFFARGRGAKASYTISGGSIDLVRKLSMNDPDPISNEFIVEGSSPSIALGGDLDARGTNATLKFVLDASGVSPIDLSAGTGNALATDGNLIADVSAYTSGSDVRIIAVADDKSISGTFGSETITGGTATVDYDNATPGGRGVWLRNIVVTPGGNPLQVTSVVLDSGTDITVTWDSVNTTTYEVLSTLDPSLALGSWDNEGEVVATGASSTFTDSGVLPGDSERFYIVRVKL